MSDKYEQQIKEVQEISSRYKKEISEKLRKIDPTLVAELCFSINKDRKMAEIFKKGDGSEAEGFGNATWDGGESFAKIVTNPPPVGSEGPTEFGNEFIEKIKTTQPA